MKYFCLLLVGVFGWGLFFQEALAQDVPKGLSVEPAFQEISFEAASTQVDFLVTLKNGTDQSITLHPSVVDFGALDESGGVAFLGESTSLEKKYALASWMKPEKDTVFLEAGEMEQLRVVVENRESLSPGGHYGALLFRVGSEDATLRENKVAVNQSISVLVFAKKEGGAIYSLVLKEYSSSGNVFLLPGQVRLRFQNGGNVHAVPRGVVTVTDPVGRTVLKGILNSESTLILPETLRTYTVALTKVANSWLPGRYRLAVAYRYDGEERFTTEIETIWMLPWQSGAVILAGLGLVWLRWRMVIQKRQRQGKK